MGINWEREKKGTIKQGRRGKRMKLIAGEYFREGAGLLQKGLLKRRGGVTDKNLT